MAIFLGTQQLLDENYRVGIEMFDGSGANVGIVTGNMQTDLSVTGRSDYGQGLDLAGAAGLASGRLGGAVASARSLAGDISGVVTGREIVPVWESESVWKGSGQPFINLELTFLCMTTSGPDAARSDVIDRVNTVMKAVYPSATKEGGRIGKVFTPPLGYQRDETERGKCTVTVGSWFKARKLVMENASFSLSKEVNRLGRPLYAVGQVTLKPYRAITFEEYRAYFTRF